MQFELAGLEPLPDAIKHVMEIGPELADLAGTAAIRVQFANGAAAHHAGGEVDALMDHDWRHGAMLAQRNCGLGGDPRPLRGLADDEHHPLPGAPCQLDRPADGTQSLGEGRTGITTKSHTSITPAIVSATDGGVSVDHQQPVPSRPGPCHGRRETLDRIYPLRGFCRSCVPPPGQAALRIGVDEHDRPGARRRLNSQVAGQHGLAGSSLAARNCDHVYVAMKAYNYAAKQPCCLVATGGFLGR
jgi:hypothetical protein